MEELDLSELFNYYLKRVPIIILITLITLLAGFIYAGYMQTPLFKASTTIILVQTNNDDDGIPIQSSLSMNESLVTTYSEIIKSKRVLNQVIDELKLKTSVNGLAGMITVNSISDTPIIEISATNNSNKDAVLIVNKVTEVFKKEVTKLYNLENVSVLDEAVYNENADPYNINNSKTLFIFAVVGVVISLAFIFIMYILDNTIKSKNVIENDLGLAVLGEIPIVEKLSKKKKNRSKKNENVNTYYQVLDDKAYNDAFNNIDNGIYDNHKKNYSNKNNFYKNKGYKNKEYRNNFSRYNKEFKENDKKGEILDGNNSK